LSKSSLGQSQTKGRGQEQRQSAVFQYVHKSNWKGKLR
jgi:hypothetical protein